MQLLPSDFLMEEKSMSKGGKKPFGFGGFSPGKSKSSRIDVDVS
jgi:hypothetical protein